MHLEVLIKITVYQRKRFSKNTVWVYKVEPSFTQIKTLKAFGNIIQKHFDVLELLATF